MNYRPDSGGVRSNKAGRLLVFVLTITVGLTASAQDFDRYRPNTPPTRNVYPGLPAPPCNPVEGSTDVLVDALRGIRILDHESRIHDPIKPFDGVQVDPAADLTVAREEAFKAVVESYVGRPISIYTLNEMARNIVLVYRDFKQPVVDVSIPPGQDITDGIVQIVITESRIADICFRCNRFYGDCNLASQSCLRRGQRIFESSLQQELVWYNQDPFRDVGVTLEAGAVPGTTNIVYEVHDNVPIRSFIGYEDSGLRLTGRERMIFGTNIGNLWDKDHQLSYQFTTDAELRGQIGVHSLVYTAPIFENRDSWTVFGSWADIDSSAVAPGLINTAQAWQISGRYDHTLCQNTCRHDQMHFGFDVKGTNSDLEFGGTTVIPTDVHIVQFVAGINSQQIYDDGQTLYGLDFVISPGDLLPRNDDVSFSRLRNGSRATYMYARGYVERLYDIDCRSDLVIRATGQISDYKLQPTEQLGYGGYNSIRGYDMRAANGDSGYIVNVEYRSKPVRGCSSGRDTSLVGLAFADFGQQFNWNAPAAGNILNGEFLASVGVGVRYVIDPNFTLRADYGLPLNFPGGIDPNAAGRHGRVHIGAVLAY